MSRKTIILTAVILVVLLIAAGIGYKALTAGRNGTSGQETGQTVPYSPETEKNDPEAEKPQAVISDSNDSESEDKSQPQDNDTTASDADAASDNAPASDPSETELPPAPDFTVYRSDGTEVHLSDFAGKPVIANFWASWCPPCREELPDFNDLYKEYGDRIEFLMVNLTDGSEETPATVSAFLLQTGYTFPVYLDTEESAAYAYSIYSIPVTIGVDGDGRLKTQRIGSMSEAEIREILDLLLS